MAASSGISVSQYEDLTRLQEALLSNESHLTVLRETPAWSAPLGPPSAPAPSRAPRRPFGQFPEEAFAPAPLARAQEDTFLERLPKLLEGNTHLVTLILKGEPGSGVVPRLLVEALQQIPTFRDLEIEGHPEFLEPGGAAWVSQILPQLRVLVLMGDPETDVRLQDLALDEILRGLSVSRGLDTLALPYNDLQDEDGVRVLRALPSVSNLTSLQLDNNNLGSQTLDLCGRYLRTHHRLQVLILAGNPLGQEAEITGLGMGLEANTGLQILDLRSCYLSDVHVRNLFDHLLRNPRGTGLRELRLDDNVAGLQGMQAGAKFLIRNPELRILSLKVYAVEGLRHLGTALTRNTHLERLTLNLDALPLSPELGEALAYFASRLEEGDTSLEWISLGSRTFQGISDRLQALCQTNREHRLRREQIVSKYLSR